MPPCNSCYGTGIFRTFIQLPPCLIWWSLALIFFGIISKKSRGKGSKKALAQSFLKISLKQYGQSFPSFHGKSALLRFTKVPRLEQFLWELRSKKGSRSIKMLWKLSKVRSNYLILCFKKLQCCHLIIFNCEHLLGFLSIKIPNMILRLCS